MAGDAFRKVATGDPIELPAAWYNATIDAINAHHRGRNPQKTRPQNLPRPEGLRYVQNVSSNDVPRFGVLSILEVIFDDKANLAELQNNGAFTGGSPDSTVGPGNFLIAAEPIAKNAVGLAWCFGVCPVQINFASSTDDWADVLSGDNTQLASSSTGGGAFVLWKQAGTGTQWSLVRIGNASSPGTAVVVKIGLRSDSDASGMYASSSIETGNATGFPPAGMADGHACTVYNEVEAGLTCNVGSFHLHLLKDGSAWPGVIAGTDPANGNPRVLISAPIDLDVTLATDGGTNAATPTGTASYTYAITHIKTGRSLQTGASPIWARPPGILTGAAGNGRIYFNVTGVLKLANTDEQPALQGC